MPKVPVYDSQIGARTPATGPQTSMDAAAAPGRAMAGLGESLGQAGGTLLKLAQQRKIRENNVKALNLHTQYSQEVNGITVSLREREGSDAIGSHDALKKELESLGKKYESGIEDPLLLEQFQGMRAQVDESHLSQIASHESQQFKVAQKTAIDNLVTLHSDMATANPNADQVALSLKTIGDEIDMHYPAEQATAMKDAAAMQVKGNFVLSLGEKNPKEAMTYLETWKKEGGLGAQNYLTLKTKLEVTNDENAVHEFDKLAESRGYSPNRVISILASPSLTDREFKGITFKQANALRSLMEDRSRWSDYQARQAKADRQEADFNAISALLDKGDIVGANKLKVKSDLNSNHRYILNNAFKEIKVGQISEEQASLYERIDNGNISTQEQLNVALRPISMSGADGRAASNTLKVYFTSRKAEDQQNYAIAEKMYQDAMKTMGLKSPVPFFASYLRQNCTAENVHGAAIVEKARKLIGYVKEDATLWFDKKVSPWKEMEKKGDVGIKASTEKKPTKPTTSTDLLKGYDPQRIEGAKAAIKKDYPNLEPTPERIKKVLDASK